MENNIAPNTQIGNIIIDSVVYEHENAYNNPKYSRGGEFIENLVTDNIIEFCKRWLHLAGFKEFLRDIEDFRAINYICYSSYGKFEPYIKDNRLIIVPIRHIDSIIKPITFSDKKIIRPIRFMNERDRSNDIKR